MRAGKEVDDLRRASEHGSEGRRSQTWSDCFELEKEEPAERMRYAYRLVFDAIYTPIETQLLKVSFRYSICSPDNVQSLLRYGADKASWQILDQ